MASNSVLGNTHSACLFYNMQHVPLNCHHLKVLSWILAGIMFIDEFLISVKNTTLYVHV